MFRKILVTAFCVCLIHEIVSSDDLAEAIQELRSTKDKLNPEWVKTYLETLMDSGLSQSVISSELRNFEKLIKHLSDKEKAREIQRHVAVFRKELYERGYILEDDMLEVENKKKREGKSLIGNDGNEDDTEEILAEDDLKTLHNILNDLYFLTGLKDELSSKLDIQVDVKEQLKAMGNDSAIQRSTKNGAVLEPKINLIKKLQNESNTSTENEIQNLVQTLMNFIKPENNEEINELQEEIEEFLNELEESEDVIFPTRNDSSILRSIKNSALIENRINWIREKAQHVNNMLSQTRILNIVQYLKSFLNPENTEEIKELEEEIEELLNELEESKDEIVITEPDKVEKEIENYTPYQKDDKDVFESKKSRRMPRELNDASETFNESKRKGKKLFKEILTEDNEKNKHLKNPTENNETVVKVWRKSFRIYAKDKIKPQTLEKGSNQDRNWKMEMYNKVFKDKENTHSEVSIENMKNRKIKSEKENGNNTKGSLKDGIIKVFGNKEKQEKENEGWKIKPIKSLIRNQNETKVSESNHLIPKNRTIKQNTHKNLFGSNETVKKEFDTKYLTESSKSWKEKLYDKISKAEKISNKTANVKKYFEGGVNETFENSKSRLKSYDVRDVKINIKNISEIVTNKSPNTSNEIHEPIEKYIKANQAESSFEYMGEKNQNKKNVAKKINEKLDNSKKQFIPLKAIQNGYVFPHKVVGIVTISSNKSTETRIPLQKKQYETNINASPPYETLTSTYNTVLLTTATNTAVYERTMTYTSSSGGNSSS